MRNVSSDGYVKSGTRQGLIRTATPIHVFSSTPIPKADPATRFEEKPLLTGELPSPTDPPPGCRFHTRCPYATERCRREVPQLRPVAGRLVACHRAEELHR
ncbi:MAG: oligopeptide/dipeptide ABC transporter ATP-binding protein [Dysosmobacter sp.]